MKWCHSEQGSAISDARQTDRKLLAGYAAYLCKVVGHGDLEVSTAQNRLSSVNRTSREANDLSRINIQDGTKGDRAGASAPRLVSVDEHVRVALGFARQVPRAGSRRHIKAT